METVEAGELCTSGTIGYEHPTYGLQGTFITSNPVIELPIGLTELKLYLQENSTGVSIGDVTIEHGVEVVIPSTSKWYFY